MSHHSVALMWFRRDLRLADNPALLAARESAALIVPVYVHAPEEEAPWQPGAASQWWLHHSLTALDASVQKLGSRLVVRHGPTADALDELIRLTGATLVCWNRTYEPALLERDESLVRMLEEGGIQTSIHDGTVLLPPASIKNGSGSPYRVFTPFFRALFAKTADLPAPHKAPRTLPGPSRWPTSVDIDDLKLLPTIRWDQGIAAAWTPGEASALKRLKQFERSVLAGYVAGRDTPGDDGTSRLSPHLHFGEIGPRQVYAAIRSEATRLDDARDKYLRELGWREFALNLLVHFPQTPEEPLDRRYAKVKWARNTRQLTAWQRGRTGIPIVDAGMRQLWETGWMHNRVRMIVASLLTKNMRVDWREGSRWFWDTLVDADLANNTLGWQWVAGCGADAAPYFRVFNPVTQSQKFDPEGRYLRRFVPELAALPDRYIHEPWTAPREVLAAANVKLGESYPKPIVDLKTSREEALQMYRAALTPN